MTREPSTVAERQKRGYDFERVLVDLFAAHDLAYNLRTSRRNEQVDGSFYFRGFAYIVEAKWQATPPEFGDFAKFKANVDGNSTAHAAHSSRLRATTRTSWSISSGSLGTRQQPHPVRRRRPDHDVDGRIALSDALSEKLDAAEQRGVAWDPLGR